MTAAKQSFFSASRLDVDLSNAAIAANSEAMTDTIANAPPEPDVKPPEYFDAYAARVEATRFVHWLQDLFVKTTENNHQVLPDLIREEKDNVRIFRIGHWRFKISVLLDDERGYPPQVWLVMETSHKDIPDPPAINIAAFVDFVPGHCRINYASEEGKPMRSLVIPTDNLKPEWFSDATLAKIRQKIDDVPRRIQSPGPVPAFFQKIANLFRG